MVEQGIYRRSHKRGPQIPEPETSPSRRRESDRFDSLPTHLPGVALRVEPGGNPNLPDSTVEGLLADAIAYKYADAREKAAVKEKDDLKLRILPLINSFPGLRGIVSEPDDAQLTAIPNEKDVEWFPDLVRGSLPTAADYHEIVTETVVVEFPKPAGVRPEVIKNVMAEAIQDLGKGILKTSRATFGIIYDINERRLASRLKALGRKLLPGARTSRIEFSLTAGPVVKNPPKQEQAE